MIRKADTREYERLTQIWEDAVRATHDFLSEEHLLEIRSRMPQYLDAVNLYVYDEDREAKGFLGVHGDNIEMLFVGTRGRGVGSALLDFAVKELGAVKIDVNEQNRSALGFYESKGFYVAGRSEKDSAGRPYPLLHMKLKDNKR